MNAVDLTDQEIIDYYNNPLKYASVQDVTAEKRRQRIFAFRCIVIGIILFVTTGIISELNNPDTSTLIGKAEGLELIWNLLVLLLTPYGLYRLIMVKRFTIKGLRNTLVHSSATAYKHHSAIEAHKSIIRQLLNYL